MAEITAKRQGEIVQAPFKILEREEDGLQAKEAVTRTEAALTLTDFERDTFPNNPDVVRFPKILRFSTINVVKAGWLLKKSGTWTITDDGRAALAKYPDPEAFFREAVRLYREWKAQQPSEAGGATTEVGGEDGGLLAAATLEEAEESARADIIRYMGTLNPYEFQELVGELIKAMGYHVVWIAPKGRDGGLDLLAQGDPLGVNGPRIKGQVKRRPESKTTTEELRAFLSLIEANDVGVFVSLGGFTGDSHEHARRSSRRITLIDAGTLLDLWVEHYSQLTERGRQLLAIRPVYFLDAAG